MNKPLIKPKKIKALLLFSGGLDSLLSAKILEQQGIKTDLITFIGFFFNAKEAKKSAKILGKKLRIMDISKKHFNIVKNPKHGRGKGLNPCTDCHLLMVKEAKKIMMSEGYQILATGEVAGQRPMSQQSRQLKLIEKNAGLKNKILRPLSALILEETIYEKQKLVDRKKLFGITGRSRKEQIKLAKKFGIKNYPTPAGGCILTDLNFTKKLKSVIDKKLDKNDIELLRVGRHYEEDGIKIIIGRDNCENLKLQKLTKPADILMEAAEEKGPLTLIRFYGKNYSPKKICHSEKIFHPGKNCHPELVSGSLKKAAELTKHHSTKTRNLDKVKIRYWNKGNKKNFKTIEI